MTCCSSNPNRVTTCDSAYRSNCCGGAPLAPGVLAGIIIGSLVLIFALAFLAWYGVRKYRRSQAGYDEFDGATPTMVAEHIDSDSSRANYAGSPPIQERKAPYGTYQSY